MAGGGGRNVGMEEEKEDRMAVNDLEEKRTAKGGLMEEGEHGERRRRRVES